MVRLTSGAMQSYRDGCVCEVGSQAQVEERGPNSGVVQRLCEYRSTRGEVRWGREVVSAGMPA
jgi:hypothetical protein